MGETLDPDKLKLYSFTVFSKLEGAVTAGMVHLGDRLGLYQVLAGASAPMSTQEIADAAGLHERWVREWAQNQAAAKLLDWTDEGGELRVTLPPEGRAVLANPDHPAFGMGMFHRLPQTMQSLEVLPDSFRTGIGHDYDSHGPEGAAGIERSFEPWYKNFLVPVALPALDGVVRRLEQGAVVADVGCGAGVAVCMMAKAFPNSEFHGYDISRHALERAERRKAETGVSNAHFHDVRESVLPTDHSVDLVTTFDCIHDMTHPQEMMHAIRAAISDEGTWLLVDIKGKATFAENARNPMAALMFGISVMSCMSSAMSAPDGAGLGTLGLPAERAQAMAESAGFTRFRTLDIEHAVNAFYEVRP